jgi:hypothetical protein
MAPLGRDINDTAWPPGMRPLGDRPITKPAKSVGNFPSISAAGAVKAPLAVWLSPEWSLLAMGD